MQVQRMTVVVKKEKNSLNASLKYYWRKSESGRSYVTYCPALKLHSQGVNLKQALLNLKESIKVVLIYAYSKGGFDSLHALLDGYGWIFNGDESRLSEQKEQFFKPKKSYVSNQWNKSRCKFIDSSIPLAA